MKAWLWRSQSTVVYKPQHWWSRCPRTGHSENEDICTSYIIISETAETRWAAEWLVLQLHSYQASGALLCGVSMFPLHLCGLPPTNWTHAVKWTGDFPVGDLSRVDPTFCLMTAGTGSSTGVTLNRKGGYDDLWMDGCISLFPVCPLGSACFSLNQLPETQVQVLWSAFF